MVESLLDRDAVEAETRLLITHYGGQGRPEDLLAMARVFDAAAVHFPVGGARLRLWATSLRVQAYLEPPSNGVNL